MSQSFKKKVITASIAAAFVVAGAGFVSVPGFATVGVASANQFAASTVDNVTSVNLYADNTTTRTLTIKVNEQGTWSNTAGRKILVTLPSNVRLTTSVTATSSASPTNVAASVSSTGIVASAATAYINSSGSTVIELTVVAADTTAGNENVTLSLAIKAPVGAAAGDVAVAIADGGYDGTAGLNISSSSVTAAKVVDTPITVTAATATSMVAGLSGQTPAAMTIKANKAYAAADLTSATMDIVLSNGAKFSAAPSIDAATSLTQGGLTVTLVNDTTARVTYTSTTAAAQDQKLVLSGAYLDLSGVTSGDVTATISGNSYITGYKSQTVTLGTAAAKGATVAYNDANGDAKKQNLFLGRTAANAAPNDAIKITESAAGSLINGGTITVSLSNGAKFVTGQVPTASVTGTLTLGAATLNSSNTTATFAVTGVTTSAAGSATISIPQVDLTAATGTGDLTVTIGGSAGVSGDAVLATLNNSASVSVSGALPVLTMGGTATLPDIVITEAVAGALAASDITLVLPTGVTFDDISGVATASTKSGGVTGISVAKIAANAVTDSGLTVTLTGTSSTATGVSTVTLKGLKVKAASSTSASAPSTGTVNMQIGGSATPTTAGDTALATKFGGNVGALLNAQTLGVASVPSSSAATIPSATATGAVTSKTVTGSITAKAADQGTIGAVYVAAALPDGSLYFKDSAGNWKLYTGAAPSAYAVVTLGNNSYDVVSGLDLSGLIGTQVYVGYGIGSPLLGKPFQDMIDNAKYNIVYTVAQ